MTGHALTRREFLLASTTAGTSALLGACTKPTPEIVQKIVRETVVVQKIVRETVVVEQVVVNAGELGADRLRDEMTLGSIPPDQEGTFTHAVFDGGLSGLKLADLRDWFATWYPNVTLESAHPYWDKYWATLPELLASGDQPDLASIHFSRVAPFACKGWMLPIDDYIAALPPPDWPEDYHKVAEDNISYLGSQYGLASEWAPRVVLINRDIMEEAGLPYPVSDTWTWDDVLENAIAATKRTAQGEQYGLILTHEPWQDWNVVRAWGGRFFSEDVTESRFDDSGTQDCFQWMWDARFVHQATPPVGTLQAHGGPFETFSAGTIGMWPTPADQVKPMVESVGDSFRLGIAPEPVGSDGARFSFDGNMGWFIPRGSSWPDIAYELMRWHASDDEQALYTALSGPGGFPARKSAGKWNVLQIEPALPGYGRAAWQLGAEGSGCFPSFPVADEWCRFWRQYWDSIWIGDEPFARGDLETVHRRTSVLLAAMLACVEPEIG